MKQLGILNNRHIIYEKYSPDFDWVINLPKSNWLLIVVVNDAELDFLSDISDNALDNNTCYISCLGAKGEILHDIIDDEINLRQLELVDRKISSRFIMTDWFEDIEEGLWFAINAANNDEEQIEIVVCLNVSDLDIESSLQYLINNHG
jgi:hypothetical protein